jgi:hypothetical protein
LLFKHNFPLFLPLPLSLSLSLTLSLSTAFISYFEIMKSVGSEKELIIIGMINLLTDEFRHTVYKIIFD